MLETSIFDIRLNVVRRRIRFYAGVSQRKDAATREFGTAHDVLGAARTEPRLLDG